MPKWAAVFDWDGVIIDSGRFHEKSWELLAREEGRALPDSYFKRGFGMANEGFIPRVLRWTQDPRDVMRLGDRKEELYRELIRDEGIEPLPGVERWLEALHAGRVQCVVASSTCRLNIVTALELIGLADHFAAIVAADDVSRGKPAPEVFLRAAEKIGMPSAQCVVFEDTHIGIEAAHAAGMKVVGVSTTHPADMLRGAARVVKRLDELAVEEIASWF
jgi:beta-phosphoglucomutase family hydrolase